MTNQAIKDYFLSFSDQLAYLELKDSNTNVADEKLNEIPLPIRAFDFLEGIEQNSFDEELELSYFLKGMIWNLGIDPDFLYAEDYKNILVKYVKNPDDYALELGKVALTDETIASDERKFEQALINFRSASLLNPENDFAQVQYANLLWQAGEGEDQAAFVQEASQILEKLLRDDAYHTLANSSLGNINEAMGNYVKAQSFYQRALSSSSEDLVQESIRADLERISTNASIENALYFIRRADYNRAIQSLMEAKNKENRYDVPYYLGVCYENIANYDAAVAAFQEAIEAGADFPEVYNDLVFSLNALGKVEEAIRYCDIGLKLYPADLRLRYNRAVLLTDQGDYQKAIEDCDFILEYADLSNEMFNETMILKEQIGRLANE